MAGGGSLSPLQQGAARLFMKSTNAPAALHGKGDPPSFLLSRVDALLMLSHRDRPAIDLLIAEGGSIEAHVLARSGDRVKVAIRRAEALRRGLAKQPDAEGRREQLWEFFDFDVAKRELDFTVSEKDSVKYDAYTAKRRARYPDVREVRPAESKSAAVAGHHAAEIHLEAVNGFTGHTPPHGVDELLVKEIRERAGRRPAYLTIEFGPRYESLPILDMRVDHSGSNARVTVDAAAAHRIGLPVDALAVARGASVVISYDLARSEPNVDWR